MKLKQILLIVGISSLSAVGSVWTYNKFTREDIVLGATEKGLPANYAGFFDGKTATAEAADFTKAANASVPAVVHIKTKIPAQKRTNNVPQRSRGFFDDWMDDFFGNGPNVIPEQRASGSGVLISEDGYIVTNNHVISDGREGVAGEINVTLHNKKSYKARLIGRDPASDIAVLKIDGNKFPFLLYGNLKSMEISFPFFYMAIPVTYN
jgi:serine protease Do